MIVFQFSVNDNKMCPEIMTYLVANQYLRFRVISFRFKVHFLDLNLYKRNKNKQKYVLVNIWIYMVHMDLFLR